MAERHPERNYLGVERLLGRVDKTAKLIRKSGVSNARVLRLDSVYAIGWLLPPQSVARLSLFCPDPWPKDKHEARRLVQRGDFWAALERVLKVGGEFLLKTDDEPYFQAALEAIGPRAGWKSIEWPGKELPLPQTEFEQQWLALGKVMHEVAWKRLAV